uniref:non-specific serine/threonine protein kinase n=1 Tax=Xiphophorus couchianus TaxID=32473 RepID=A0A3B5LJH2_9TELE
MAMELCAGGDLMDRICDRRRLGEREVRRYTRQILSAVEHLHKHGIVHRDLKIENFLLDEHNNIKIVDFGLSNTLKPDSLSLELLNTQCGSPAYAAPELLAHKKYGSKVDVWSIPSAVMASYHLLLIKFNRSHKGAKASKVNASQHTDTKTHRCVDMCHESLAELSCRRPFIMTDFRE